MMKAENLTNNLQ